MAEANEARGITSRYSMMANRTGKHMRMPASER